MCNFCDKIFKQLHNKYTFHIVVKQRKDYTTYVPVPNLADVRFEIDDNHSADGVSSSEHQILKWKFCPCCGKELPKEQEDNK